MNNKQEWEKYQLKQKAMKYYQKNKVPEKMEYVLNHMFHEDPVDVFGYLVCKDIFSFLISSLKELIGWFIDFTCQLLLDYLSWSFFLQAIIWFLVTIPIW